MQLHGEDMEDNFNDWLMIGIDNGWVSRPVCSTHEGLPTNREEDLEWDEGGDPCIYAVRLFSDENERQSVYENMGHR